MRKREKEEEMGGKREDGKKRKKEQREIGRIEQKFESVETHLFVLRNVKKRKHIYVYTSRLADIYYYYYYYATSNSAR